MRASRVGRLNARFARTAASFLFLTTIAITALDAQQPAQAMTSLTLEEAIALARRNNPDLQALKNDLVVADWAVREAYGGLLPSARASASFSYQAAGRPRFGIFTGSDLGIDQTPAYYSSDYFVGLGYNLNGSVLLAPRREKAMRQSTEASIAGTDFDYRAIVTRQYLAVMRAQDGVLLNASELQRADENLKFAQAKVTVGTAIPLEAKQAEVERGRSEVALLQSRNLVQTERLRLIQQLGIEINPDVELTTKFNVFDLTYTQEQLLQFAMEQHPFLLAARATEEASDVSVKMARTAYLPSLDLSAGLSGYTRQAGNTSSLLSQARNQVIGARQNCEFNNALSAGLSSPLPGYPQDCTRFVLTSEQEREIINSNNVFPFNFSQQPWSAQLSISLPVFQGFSRERQIEQAKAASADARHRTRAEELRIKTEASAAYLDVITLRQTVQLETRNRDLADEQLALARERYRVGVATFLELQEAETIKARADRAYLIALYSFHEGVAALETATGRNLRPVGESQ